MIKKSLLLFILATCAIFVDGTLTHDIFDYRLDSFSMWATATLVLVIILAISFPQTTKNSKDKNNL